MDNNFKKYVLLIIILTLTLASFALESCSKPVAKSSLSVEELANEGTHDYETYTKVLDNPENCGSSSEPDYLRPTIKFYKDQVEIGSNQVYTKISNNTYQIFLNFDSLDMRVTITFNKKGFSRVTETFEHEDPTGNCVWEIDATIIK